MTSEKSGLSWNSRKLAWRNCKTLSSRIYSYFIAMYRMPYNLDSPAAIGSSDKWHLVFLRTRTFVISATRCKNLTRLPTNCGPAASPVWQEFRAIFQRAFRLSPPWSTITTTNWKLLFWSLWRSSINRRCAENATITDRRGANTGPPYRMPLRDIDTKQKNRFSCNAM